MRDYSTDPNYLDDFEYDIYVKERARPKTHHPPWRRLSHREMKEQIVEPDPHKRAAPKAKLSKAEEFAQMADFFFVACDTGETSPTPEPHTPASQRCLCARMGTGLVLPDFRSYSEMPPNCS